MRCQLIIPLLLVITACRTTLPSGKVIPIHPTPDVTIDHNNGTVDPVGLIRKKTGEAVWIHIQNTNTDCYSFNIKTEPTQVGAEADHPMNQPVDFHFIYDGTPTKITVEAYQKMTCGTDLSHTSGGRFPPWEILIDNAGWDLNFSGGFTMDNLTDPVFGLVSTKKALDPANPTNKTDGYLVQQFSGQEDNYKLGAAAFVHLMHTDPEYLGRADINWVPVAFGLGVNQGSQVRYYLGTGVKFAKKMFLSGGFVFGSVHTLPVGLTTDPKSDANFTTNANALASLPSRVRSGFYIGVSYTFAGNPEPFQTPFTTTRPAPTTPEAQAPTGKPNTYAVEASAVDATTHTAAVGLTAGKSETINFVQQLHPDRTDATFTCKKTQDKSDCTPLFQKDIPNHQITGSLKMAPNTTYQLTITETFGNKTVASRTLTTEIFTTTDKTKPIGHAEAVFPPAK